MTNAKKWVKNKEKGYQVYISNINFHPLCLKALAYGSLLNQNTHFKIYNFTKRKKSFV